MITQWGRKCPACGDEIYSNSVHDFEECHCGALFIDGGFEYERVGFRDIIDPGGIERVSREVDPKHLIARYDHEPQRRTWAAGATR